jgi:hypothetical protein
MARVEITEEVKARGGRARSGVAVTVREADGTLATLYNAATGGTTLPNPTTTDADGQINAYVDEGSYSLSAEGRSIDFQALNADERLAGTGLSFATTVQLDAEIAAREAADTVLGDAIDDVAEGVGAPNSQTADYTLALADAGGVVEMSHANAKIIQIPANASVAFAIGTVINVARMGAGDVSIEGAVGVTMLPAGPNLVANQYGVVSLRKRATNEWHLVGDLA